MASITISRQYGSLGEEIAVRVCEQLGYRYFDRRLMEAMVSELVKAGEPIVDLCEDNYHVRTTLERILSTPTNRPKEPCRSWIEEGPGGLRMAEMTNLDEEAAIKHLQSAIKAAYCQGNILILGRGGQVILKDQPEALHVRIQAPFEKRVETVVRHCMITHPEAREVITHKDRAAGEYLKHFYHVDWADPRLYHLVIDTGLIDIDTAASIIVQAVGCLTPINISA